MPAQLLALNDGPNILVDKPILLIGRHPECDIQIESRKISRRHCCIAQVNDYLVIRDLDSTNGVRINGVRVVEGRLATGDELTIGNHRYRVCWDDPAQQFPAAQQDRGRGLAPALARATPQDEDEMLEECDEPVALPDPGPAGKPSKPVAPPPPEEDLTARGNVEDSFILPENLKLAPGNSSFPGHASAPPQG